MTSQTTTPRNLKGVVVQGHNSGVQGLADSPEVCSGSVSIEAISGIAQPGEPVRGGVKLVQLQHFCGPPL